jgi:hypothetical protein
MENNAFFEKLAKFRDLLNGMDWSPDGVNTHQGYKFLSESKMKGQIGPALVEAGLEWRATYSDVKILDPVGSMRTHIMLTLTVDIFDGSGQTSTYVAYGTAADSGDKAMSKAQTNALKNLIANNWLVSSFDAETEGELESKTASKGYVTPERAEEIKQELAKKQQARQADRFFSQEPQTQTQAPADVSPVQRTAIDKLYNKLKTLDSVDIEQYGGMVAIDNEYHSIKTSKQAAEFINKYRGI